MVGHAVETEDRIVVRSLRPADLEAVIALDARNSGRRREQFFRYKLEQNLRETGIQVSLAAEVDGSFTGFLLARVFYGEFGVLEPVAVLETVGVHPGFCRQGIGRALLAQLRLNLAALHVRRLRTEVGWEAIDLLAFFHHAGFRPAERLCLDLDLDRTRPAEARQP